MTTEQQLETDDGEYVVEEVIASRRVDGPDLMITCTWTDHPGEETEISFMENSQLSVYVAEFLRANPHQGFFTYQDVLKIQRGGNKNFARIACLIAQDVANPNGPIHTEDAAGHGNLAAKHLSPLGPLVAAAKRWFSALVPGTAALKERTTRVQGTVSGTAKTPAYLQAENVIIETDTSATYHSKSTSTRAEAPTLRARDSTGKVVKKTPTREVLPEPPTKRRRTTPTRPRTRRTQLTPRSPAVVHLPIVSTSLAPQRLTELRPPSPSAEAESTSSLSSSVEEVLANLPADVAAEVRSQYHQGTETSRRTTPEPTRSPSPAGPSAPRPRPLIRAIHLAEDIEATPSTSSSGDAA